MLELHAIFHGRVQGVGFRATAMRYAEELNLTGFARNLPDHSVEVVAQGTKEALEALVTKLQSRFSIEKVEKTFRDVSRTYSKFTI